MEGGGGTSVARPPDMAPDRELVVNSRAVRGDEGLKALDKKLPMRLLGRV